MRRRAARLLGTGTCSRYSQGAREVRQQEERVTAVGAWNGQGLPPRPPLRYPSSSRPRRVSFFAVRGSPIPIPLGTKRFHRFARDAFLVGDHGGSSRTNRLNVSRVD